MNSKIGFIKTKEEVFIMQNTIIKKNVKLVLQL